MDMQEKDAQERRFPICQTGTTIPWSVAERAYEAYAKKYGKGQSLERLAQRGGFYTEEMDQLYPPWRDDVSEITRLTTATADLQQRLDAAEEALRVAQGEVERLQRLADDMNRTANGAFLDGRKNAEAEFEAEQGRWQQAIYDLLGELAPGADIDGGGCDSGDPLDFTLDEISQGFSHWANLLSETLREIGHDYEGSTFTAASEKIKSDHKALTAANSRVERLEQELETERIRLAGCGVAAMCDTEQSIKEQGIDSDSSYYSASYGDVCRMVRRLMRYRGALEKLAQLGNEPHLGNSDGNVIAQKALADDDKEVKGGL